MMIDFTFSVASRGLSSFRVCAVLSTWALLCLCGCDDKTNIRETSPQGGSVNIDKRTKVVVRFQSGFTDRDDTDDETLSESMTVIGDKTPRPYEGTVRISSFEDATDDDLLPFSILTDEEDREDEEEDRERTTEHLLSGNEEKQDSLVFELLDGVNYKDGETVTVFVHGNFTVRGNSVDAQQFSFTTFLQPPTHDDLTNLRVLRTEPTEQSASASLEPRMAAKFTRPIVGSSVAGNVVIQGEKSGTVLDPVILVTDVDEISARLQDGSSFLPGEWVSVTLSDGIMEDAPEGGPTNLNIGDILGAAISGDESALEIAFEGAASDSESSGPDPLSRFNWRFQVTPGSMSGRHVTENWITNPAVVFDDEFTARSGEAIAVASGQLNPDMPGVEFAILFEQRVICFDEDGVMEGFIDLAGAGEFVANPRGVDLAIYDFNQSGTPEILVLIEGDTSSLILVYRIAGFETDSEGVLAPIFEELERFPVPATDLYSLKLADIDSDGGADVIVHHKRQTILDALAESGASDDSSDAREEDDTRDNRDGDDDNDNNDDNAPPTIADTPLTRGLGGPISGIGPLFLLRDLNATDVLQEIIPINMEVERYELADLDSDGKLDLIVEAEDGVHVMRNATSSTEDPLKFDSGRMLADLTDPHAWTVADVDRDRDLDVIAWDSQGALLYVNTVFSPAPEVDPMGDNRDEGDQSDQTLDVPTDETGLIFETILPIRNAVEIGLDLPFGTSARGYPWIGDVNGDGGSDVLVSHSEDGVDVFFGRTPNSSEDSQSAQSEEPYFTAAGRFEQSRNGSLVDFEASDLDGDTGLDALLVFGPPAPDSGEFSRFQWHFSHDVDAPVVDKPLAEFGFDLCTDSESPQVDGCVEGTVQVADGALLEIPVQVTSTAAFSGYTILLEYDDAALSFIDFQESFQIFEEGDARRRFGDTAPTLVVCPGTQSPQTCEGFAQIQVTSRNTDSGRPASSGRGTDLFLGRARFRGLEAATTSLRLVRQVEDDEGQVVASTSIESVDGAGRFELTETVSVREDQDITVIVEEPPPPLPPVFESVVCEAGEIRGFNYDVTVAWMVSPGRESEVRRFRIFDSRNDEGSEIPVEVRIPGEEPRAPGNVSCEFLGTTELQSAIRSASYCVEESSSRRISVRAYDASGVEIGREDCGFFRAPIFIPDITVCEEEPPGTIKLSWQVNSSAVVAYRVRDGNEERLLGGTNEFYTDDLHQDGDFYEVAALRSGQEGPRASCKPGVDTLIPPVIESFELVTRVSPADNNVLRLQWRKLDVYSRFDVELLRETSDGTMAVFIPSISTTRGQTSIDFVEPGEPGGLPPGRYEARIYYDATGERFIPSGVRNVLIPQLGGDVPVCEVVDGNASVSWTAWAGYTHFEVRARDTVTRAQLWTQILAGEERSYVFEDLALTGNVEFGLTGVVKRPNDEVHRTDARWCQLEFDASLHIGLAETGVNTDRDVRIPIVATLPSSLSGFSGTLAIPDILTPKRDESAAPDDFSLGLELNEDLVRSEPGVRRLTRDSNGNYKIQVSGMEIQPGNQLTIASIVGRIDWSHENAVIGRYPIEVDENDPLLMFFPGTEEGTVSTFNEGLEPEPAELLVHGRYFRIDEAVETIEIDGDEIVRKAIVPITLALDDQQNQNPRGYDPASFTFVFSYDVNLLSLNSSSMETLLPAGQELLSLDLGGIVLYSWSLGSTGSIPSGQTHEVFNLEFTFRDSAKNGREFTPIFFFRLPDTPTAMQYAVNPTDGLPRVGYLGGGIRLLPEPNQPVLEEVTPAVGPVVGGNKVTLRGRNLVTFTADPESSSVSVPQAPVIRFLELGTDVDGVQAEVDMNNISANEVTFTVRTDPSFASIFDSSRTVDLHVEPSESLSTNLNASYTFEPLSVVSTNVLSIASQGGDNVTIRGAGLSPSTEVEFRIDGSMYRVTEILSVPSDGRQITFLSPEMTSEGGNRAQIFVDADGFGQGLEEVQLAGSIPVDGQAGPRVGKVTPSVGSEYGGSLVTVEVSGFTNLNGARVTFGGQEALDIVPDPGGDSFTARTPASSVSFSGERSVAVEVTVDNESDTRAGLFSYLEARVASLTPSAVSEAGSMGSTVQLSVRGFNLAGVQEDDVAILFANRSGTVEGLTVTNTERGEADITVSVPSAGVAVSAEGLDVDVSIFIREEGSRVAQNETGTDLLRYTQDSPNSGAAIVSLDKDSGRESGGDEVRIEVVNFDLTGVVPENVQVLLGDNSVTEVLEVTETDAVEARGFIRVTTPSAAPAVVPEAGLPVDVRVTIGGQSAVSTGAFTYLKDGCEQSNLSLFSASSACDDPSTATVTGRGFCVDMTVRFDTVEVLFALVDSNTFTVTVPGGADSSHVTIDVTIDGTSFVNWTGELIPASVFIRGDVNDSGIVDFADASVLSEFLAGANTGQVRNLDAFDINDDGIHNTGDLVFLTSYLWAGTVDIPPPHPEPGTDSTEDLFDECPQNGSP